MRTLSCGKRAGAMVAAASVLLMLNAPSASANWSSYISGWTDGDESRRWSDRGNYSQVLFRDCYAQYGGTKQSVVVRMWKHVALQPDRNLGGKKYTRCFKGANKWSNGQWRNLPSGPNTLYFETHRVSRGGSCCLLFVDKVYVNTSKAD